MCQSSPTPSSPQRSLRRSSARATFFTATDGNHGRGVAWAANRLGQRAVVHMPKGTTRARLENIAREGAQVDIQELNYDDCVRLAAREAAETPRGVIVQDTAWEGYEEIPSWIMEGYGTMAMEAGEQLKEAGDERPTHVFVQAGVGSLAGAVVGYFANLYADNPPIFVVVEAQAADCLYQGAKAGDGTIRTVGGDMETIMAGLACGEPNTISWDILKNHVKVFISLPDWAAAQGMRMLAAPIKGGCAHHLRGVRSRALRRPGCHHDHGGICGPQGSHRIGRNIPGAGLLHRGRHRPGAL